MADAYDAMTSDRSYRKKISDDEAINKVNKNAGIQFDPKVVMIFIKITDNTYKLDMKFIYVVLKSNREINTKKSIMTAIRSIKESLQELILFSKISSIFQWLIALFMLTSMLF